MTHSAEGLPTTWVLLQVGLDVGVFGYVHLSALVPARRIKPSKRMLSSTSKQSQTTVLGWTL